MKSIFFTLLSIFAILPALAVSLPILDPRARSANADKVIAYFKNSANSAQINPACFFSGQTIETKKDKKGRPLKIKHTADSKLNAFKHANSCHVIADIVNKAEVNPNVLSPQDWSDVSEALAQTVKGTVYVLLGKDVRSNSVWLKDERPALKANVGVTTVGVWEIDTDGTVKKTNKTKTTL